MVLGDAMSSIFPNQLEIEENAETFFQEVCASTLKEFPLLKEATLTHDCVMEFRGWRKGALWAIAEIKKRSVAGFKEWFQDHQP